MGENDSKPRTVRVKIAVAVDPAGMWIAHGFEGATFEDVGWMLDGLSPGERRFWVEAELPYPIDCTVQGTAEEAKSDD